MVRWFILSSLLLVQSAAAAPAADAASPKIGYVDMARAMSEVEEGKSARAKLKADFDRKQQKLDKMQADFKTKKDEFDKRVAMMKPEARQAKEQELQQQLMEVQKTYMQLQQELAESEGQVLQEITKKLRSVIEKMGDKDSYLVILNTGDNVLYHKRHMDMTDDVIRQFNKQFAKN